MVANVAIVKLNGQKFLCSVCIPTNSVRGFPFLHTLSSIYYL